ncbi:MAG: alpha-glucosidase [Lachnospiraceae bacterium]|nr:alpha-glucosidase [Lachnospiraceae bacterium]
MKQDWWKNAVVYQIYPRSFMDSNGDGIGDLDGITQKLDYLKELGVDVIWLSPIYRSPNVDNGYDISDYQDIMEEFGSMEDFDRMLEKAHFLGIKIMMDLVVNHTSNQHFWFLESKKSTDAKNPYRDYYLWRDGQENGKPPNNWGASFGGSAWTYDETRGQYYLHLFAPEQPDLNWENPAVREKVFETMDWWCKKGVDGFRLDVISMISKVPGLPDGEKRDGQYGNGEPFYQNGPRVHEYLREMNQKVLSRYPLITVGETPGASVEDAALYAGNDTHELNMIFQFEHVDGDPQHPGRYGKWDQKKMPLSTWKRILSQWQTGLEGRGWNSLYLSNHDQPRAVSRFGNDTPQYRVLSAKMLATCLHMMKGTPYIYQGEELGMTNAYFDSLEDYRDIESLNAYQEITEIFGEAPETVLGYLKKIGRDNARTPMQWENSINAGFTTGTPWIPVNPNYKEICAQQQLPDPNSVFQYYRQLISLRHTMDIIVYGTYELLAPESEELFVYSRTLDSEKLIVLCNFTDQNLPLPACVSDDIHAKTRLLISNYQKRQDGILRPYESSVYHIVRLP